MEALDISTLIGELSPFLTFLVITLYIFKDTINEKLKEWRSIKKIEDLSSHDVFLTTENVRKSISNIEFITNGKPDAVKTKVFRHLIITATGVIDLRIRGLINDSTIDKDSGQKLKFKCVSFVNETIVEYNKVLMNDFISWGISDEDALYCIKSYNAYRSDMINAIIERTDSICANEDYNTNYDKISAVLEVVAISLFLIPKDAKDVFDSLNGKFVKYNNLI